MVTLTGYQFKLEDGDLFFVNRAESIKALKEIHRTNYSRGRLTTGLNWRIPLADYLFGIGKTSLGKFYVAEVAQQVVQQAAQGLPVTDVEEAIARSITVHVVMERGMFGDMDSIHKSLVKIIRRSLAETFEQFEDFSPPCETLRELLEAVVHKAGFNLFLHFDEVRTWCVLCHTYAYYQI